MESVIQLHSEKLLREGVLSPFVSLSVLPFISRPCWWIYTMAPPLEYQIEEVRSPLRERKDDARDSETRTYRSLKGEGPDKSVLSLQLSEEMLNKTSEACWSWKNSVFTSKTGFRRRRQSGQVETEQGLKWLLILGLPCLLTSSSSVDEGKAI